MYIPCVYNMSAGVYQATITYLVFRLLYNTLTNQFVSVYFDNSRMFSDHFVHKWLCEHRLVYFIMTITTITYLNNERISWKTNEKNMLQGFATTFI